jgi:hypothetical protein
MNARNEKYRQKISAACQPHVGEPVRAVGLFQPQGTAGAAAAMLVTPLVGGQMRRDAQAIGGGVPEVGLYALTDTALHVMEGKPRGFNWKVKTYVGSWPRSSFTAEAVSGRVTDQVELRFEDDTTIRLESMRMGAQGFNEEIIDALVAGPTDGATRAE